MSKKTLGFIIAALLIGSMVVIMVKSNLDKPKPIDEFLIGAEFGEVDGAARFGKRVNST